MVLLGAWLGSVWVPVWADGSAGEVSCSPGFHGVQWVLFSSCVWPVQGEDDLFSHHITKNGEDRNKCFSQSDCLLVLDDSNQTLICFSPGSFHSLCHGCRKSLIFSIFFVFLLVCSPSVHSISTAPLLFAVLHLPKGRLKYLSLRTLFIPAVFGLLFFPRPSCIANLGQEKQGSNQSTQLLCHLSEYPPAKLVHSTCKAVKEGVVGPRSQHSTSDSHTPVFSWVGKSTGIMVMIIESHYNSDPFYSGRKSVIFLKHLK